MNKSSIQRVVGKKDVEPVVKETIRVRKPFLGKKVTPENRHLVREFFYNIFLQKVSADEEYADMSYDDKVRAANFYAVLEVRREQKHYEAWLENKLFYTYHKQQYPVLREQIDGQATYLSDVMDLEAFTDSEEE